MRFIFTLFFAVSFLHVFAQQPRSSAPRSTTAPAGPTPMQRALRNAVIIQQGEQLNLQTAIQTALERNYQIRIARAQEQVANINNTLGAAGVLPFVGFTAQRNLLLQNLRQDFFNALTPAQRLYGVNNRNASIGPTLNWTVFNGFGMFIVLDQQREQVRLSEVNTRANIELTVANTATAYYNVVQQLQQLLALRQALDISKERLELARANYEVGTRSRVDFLTAQVDYNTDSSALVGQEQLVRNAKITLNTLLVRDPVTEFAVRDTILVRTDLQREALQAQLNDRNPQLVTAVYNRRLATLNTKLLRSQQYPTVNLVGGYTFNFLDNEAGFGTRRGRNETYLLGLQLNVPIFNGFNQRRLIQGARVNEVIADDQIADARLQLTSTLDQTFTNYQNSIKLINLQAANYRIALENVDIAYERYRVGNSTAVEFRDVQRAAVAAQAALIQAEFNAKAAEIELLRLSSTITQEIK